MNSLAKLVLRLTFGGLIAGHGSQKLFGWFNGPGLQGTAGWLESMGLQPGQQWAYMASATEFGGGTLTALGLFHPLGPILTLGSMGMASTKVHQLHKGKPIWVTEGGAELPLTNIAIALSLILAGPGKLSLDALFDTELPGWIAIPGIAAVAAGVAYAIKDDLQAMQEQRQEIGTLPETEASAETSATR